MAMVCTSGEQSPHHPSNQMKKLHSAVAVAALCIGAAMPTQAAAFRSQQEFCELNQGDAIRVFNQNARNGNSKIATLTGAVRAVNRHPDAFWNGGQIITGCQFTFRSVGNDYVLGRFNVERLSTGRIMVGTASWSSSDIPFSPHILSPAARNARNSIDQGIHLMWELEDQMRRPAVLDTQTLIPLRGLSVRCAAMHC